MTGIEGGQPKLFIFPHAGGTPQYYVPFAKTFTIDVKRTAVQYPGQRGKQDFASFTSLPALADEIEGYARASWFLSGAVFASLMAMMWLTYACLKRTEVIPYVADGGVFGCEVKTVAPPRPESATPPLSSYQPMKSQP